jgi:hypothetical protein
MQQDDPVLTALNGYLEAQVIHQWVSCQPWITKFRLHPDGPSVRALSFALGRVAGALQVLRDFTKGKPGYSMPPQVAQVETDYARWFEQLLQVRMVLKDL